MDIMHPIEHQLHQDHYHFSRLLRCLQRQVSAYEGDGLWAPQLTLILDVLDYIKVYPEHWHHPVEDKVFACLARKYPQHREVIVDVRAEHTELEHLTRELEGLFSAVANDNVVPMSQLVSDMQSFLERQLAHIEREDRLIYPLMASGLTESDWALLATEVESVEDPLFGPTLRQEYGDLFGYVLDSERSLQAEILMARGC